MDWVMPGATELVSKGDSVRKVALSALTLLRRPLFKMPADLAEVLMEGACLHKGLLAKQFANNWNQGYQ